jgi:hypothetical protein
MFSVNIIEIETDSLIETIPAPSERAAERIERGININLNHDKYYTEIKEQENHDNTK